MSVPGEGQHAGGYCCGRDTSRQGGGSWVVGEGKLVVRRECGLSSCVQTTELPSSSCLRSAAKLLRPLPVGPVVLCAMMMPGLGFCLFRFSWQVRMYS